MKPLKKYKAVAASQITYFIMYVIATISLVYAMKLLAHDIMAGHNGLALLHSFLIAFLVAWGGISMTEWAKYYHEDSFWYLHGFTPLIIHVCFVWTQAYYFVQRLKLLPP